MIRPALFSVLFAAFLLCGSLLHAQPTSTRRDATIWYFGTNAGLSFETGTAVPLTNSKLNTHEGSAVICHPITGRLLFYTDGVTVWDSTHAQMPNGTGLKGHWTSAQSAIIVPLPNDSTIFYVFTTGAGLYHQGPDHGPNNNGLRYSIVDMKLNGGRGDVTVKNVSLLGQATEMLTATRHCNGVDYWVIAHDWSAGARSAFRSYHLTPQGITDTTISPVGIDFKDGRRTQNMAKLSSTGKLLAVTSIAVLKAIELYDFDNATGTISNARLIDTGATANFYSPAFSSDNSKLYTSSLADNSNPNFLYQYDLTTLDAQTIRSSRYQVYRQTGTWQGGQIQLAPDGKIYVSYYGQNALGIINNPNLSGAACNYVHNGLNLAGKGTQYGLPNFIDSDVFGTWVSRGVDAQVTMEGPSGPVSPGQTVAVRLIVCNNSTAPLANVAVDVTLPTGLSYIGGLNGYPRHTIAMLAPNTCDTVTMQARVDPSQPGGARITTCAVLSTPGSTDCLFASDSSCLAFQVVVPVGPVDYTFYALAACPGVHDTVQVLFHSIGYTDTITGISFSGSYAQYFEYAGPRPVIIPITPTSDQHIPVHVRWPGVANSKVTGVMTLTTSAGDTVRVAIEGAMGMVSTPVLDVKAVHFGTQSGIVDTCLTVRNISSRTIQLTDSTWLRGATGSARVVSPALPIKLSPGGQATLCIEATNPSPSMSDTLMLGGMEIWECPHCALAIIVVDGLPRSAALSGVETGGGVTGGVQMRVSPNPASARAEVEMHLREAQVVRVAVVGGDGIDRLVVGERRYDAGRHILSIDVAELPGGSYWVVVEGAGVRSVQRLVVVH